MNWDNVLVLRSIMHMKPKDVEAIRDDLLHQFESGVMIIPAQFEVLHVPKNDIDDVKIIFGKKRGK